LPINLAKSDQIGTLGSPVWNFEKKWHKRIFRTISSDSKFICIFAFQSFSWEDDFLNMALSNIPGFRKIRESNGLAIYEGNF